MSRLSSSLRLIVVAALATLGGCDSPCVQLGHAICDCETSETAQQSCRKSVDDREDSVDISSEEEKTCSQLLDSCKCEELAAGNFAACGLSAPAENP